jgi:threonine aldolase
VFAVLPHESADRLAEKSCFTTGTGGERGALMTAFDTTEADVDAFVAAIVEELGA